MHHLQVVLAFSGMIARAIASADTTGGFFESVERHLACQYACSLLEDCAAGEGSVCEAGQCKGIKSGIDGYCFDCEEGDSLNCDEAMLGLFASMTNAAVIDNVVNESSNATETPIYTPPDENSNEEDWVFGFIPDWLKPGNK